MCGIAGIARFDGAPVDRDALEHMAAEQHHRGPDGSGSVVEGHVGLAHRRLSIIDVAGSQQPMLSRDGRFALTYNGEVFNYRQLRCGLPGPWRTTGDTEVLLELLARDGLRALDRVRGQFAFALHDRLTGELWLVRDRVGVLPLHYSLDERRLLFASEAKALLAVLEEPPALDEAQVAPYLLGRAVPAPGTLLRGVRKLLPGHVLHVDRHGVAASWPWWVPPEPHDLRVFEQDAEAVATVARHLEDAVEEALVADVPVGAYLSGGVDSSLLVALAAGRTGSPMHTFSAGFGDPRTDETGYARQVAELFDTQHHEVQVRALDFESLWASLTRHRDAPVSEPADVAVHLLARAAGEHVKVVLSGEGSDELFGGYPKYRWAGATRAAGVLPAPFRAGLAAAVEPRLTNRVARLRQGLHALGAEHLDGRLRGWFAPFSERECRRLLGAPLNPQASPLSYRDGTDALTRLDLQAWLPDNLLERGDRMTMAASIELRPPFLDARLVDLALAMPRRYKVRGRTTKWVLKEVAEQHLPRQLVHRRKVGFRVPLDAWFRGGLRDMSRDLLLGPDAFVADVLDRAEVSRLLEEHEQGRDREMQVWTLLSLEVWGRQVLRGRAARVPGGGTATWTC